MYTLSLHKSTDREMDTLRKKIGTLLWESQKHTII